MMAKRQIGVLSIKLGGEPTELSIGVSTIELAVTSISMEVLIKLAGDR
jgi:hypothetical protein